MAQNRQRRSRNAAALQRDGLVVSPTDRPRPGCASGSPGSCVAALRWAGSPGPAPPAGGSSGTGPGRGRRTRSSRCPAPPAPPTEPRSARTAHARPRLRSLPGPAPRALSAHAAPGLELRMRASYPDARPLQSPCALSCPTLSARPRAGPGLSKEVPVFTVPVRRPCFAPVRTAEVAGFLLVSRTQRAAVPRAVVSEQNTESERKDQAFLRTARAAGPTAQHSPPLGPRGWRFPEEPWPRTQLLSPPLPPLRHAQRAPPAAPAARRPRARAPGARAGARGGR